jgi:2-phosphosulfolactate phosphatase
MRTIRFCETADAVTEGDVKGRIAVVVDVLRATSTIVTALHNGCRTVIPVKEVEEAFAAAAGFSVDEVILGGEREGKPVPGFHFGNSPQEYARDAVAGKVVISTTTNGTRALVNSGAATETLVLSFLNLTAVTEYVRQSVLDICMVAAGNYGQVSLEDSACCGFFVKQLLQNKSEDFSLEPEVVRIMELADEYDGRVLQLLHDSPHGRFLQEIGYGSDLAVCARVDSCPMTPLYLKGRINIVR